MQTETFMLEDDGQVPNNSALPLVVIHDAFPAGTTADAAIATFTRNGWQGAWVNGIFDYHHYHARSHEVLANFGQGVRVQFGGAAGPVLEFPSRAVVVIPAGGGHCRLSSGVGLTIVGAYPTGQESWDLKRGDNPSDYARAKAEIAAVPLPSTDPLTGNTGFLLDAWQL